MKPAPHVVPVRKKAASLWAVVWLSVFGITGSAFAQQPAPILALGNAAVTGFSGAIPPAQIAPGADPAEETFIDENGPVLRIVDLQHMGGLPNAQLVNAPKPVSWFASQIGQVFGVATDDAVLPNIYVAASSAYGLPIVVRGSDNQPRHSKTGAPGATFMPGLWGAAAAGGGPGSIWKIDGVTGAVSLFANVTLDGRANSGAALGGVAYDSRSKSLFVADRETGFIHRFNMSGVEMGRYDHGVTGRQAVGLPPVSFDPTRRLDIARPQFDSRDSATWNYAPPQRRIFGLAVFKNRLYYAVADGLQIWSVSLAPDGAFGRDASIELAVPPAAAQTEISKITFDEQGRMFLGERPAPTGAFDFEALTREGIGRVLRYAAVSTDPDGHPVWQQEPDQYAIGFPLQLTNGNGGVAIGYRYDADGNINFASCGGFLWSTGEELRETADAVLRKRLSALGALGVDGLQGNETWRIERHHELPLYAYFIDYDDRFDDTAARGHLGDIAIVRACTPRAEEIILPHGYGISVPMGPPGGCPAGQVWAIDLAACVPGSCPPHQVWNSGANTCSPGGCPPGQVWNRVTRNCQPGNCPPGQIRDRHTQECTPCSRPNVRVGGQCCTPASLVAAGGLCPPGGGCQPGTIAIGPSGSCCPSGQVYNDPSGAQACCAGPLVNGRCQPPPPPPICPTCCAPGYTQTASGCCLAGQVTSSGVCCPAGQTPLGAACTIKIPIKFPPPSCCAAGSVPVGPSGKCCPVANVTTEGLCCPVPVDPTNRGSCPAQIQSIIKCAQGYTKMPDGSCCRNGLVSRDGKSCGRLVSPPPPPPPPPPPRIVRTPVLPSPAPSCAARGNYVRDSRHAGRCMPCTRGRFANEDHTACIRRPHGGHVLPPPIAACGARFIRNPRNPGSCIACPRGEVANRSHTACIPPRRYGPVYEPVPPVYGPGPYYPGFGRPPRFFGPPGGGFHPGGGFRGGVMVPR